MSIFDDGDEQVVEELESDIKSKFSDNFDNLRKDINSVELMLSSIHKHIMVLEAQITQIEATIKNAATSGADKGKLYQILNKAQELLSSYYDNYNRFAETKYKYRKEQNDLNYKVVRMIEIEMRNVKNLMPSHFELLEMMKSFQFENKTGTNKIIDDLDIINSDPTYEL
jgi:septal ring factor EnvC (AmiA/AmiB activator)